jgi:mannitol-specific phosphotransferase system IIBC component
MNDFDELTPLFGIVLFLSIPIVAIVMVFITSIKKKNRDTELRLALVQQGTDAETAKLLIEEQAEKHDKYSSLRWACVLIGAGLGALCNGLCGVDTEDVYFWIAIAAGMGIGLLISFIVEYKLTKKEQQEKSEA